MAGSAGHIGGRGMNVQYIVAVFVCLFGSGGIALWLLNRIAKASDDRNSVAKDIKEIKSQSFYIISFLPYFEIRLKLKKK